MKLEKRESIKESKRNKYINRADGITLVALVVTIIVLLILAGITISALTGDNGLINSAKDAKSETELAQIKEQIAVDLIREERKATIDRRDVTNKNIEDVLEKYGDVIKDDDGNPIGVKVGEDEILLEDIYDITTGPEVAEGGGTQTTTPTRTPTPSSNPSDTTPPVVTIGSPSKTYIKEGESATFSITLSEVATMDSSKITVSGATGAAVSVTVSGTNYTVTVTGGSGSGAITLTVGAGAFKDAANNSSAQVTKTGLTVDTAAPNVIITNETAEISILVTIKIVMNDSSSGLASIQKPDAGTITLSGEASYTTTYNVTRNGTYSFTVTDRAGNTTTESITVSNIDTTVAIVEPPIVAGGLTPIKWDDSTNPPTELVTTANDPYWYSYKAQSTGTASGGTSKWANAKTQNGSMLVWIPRYEYKITSGEKGEGLSKKEDAGTIDVKFIPLTQTTPSSGYIIHPAFTNTGNNGLGELAGIWVGKFESSNDGSGNVKIVPGVQPYTKINISTMFNKSQAFATNNSLIGYDSHVVKNTEWGAVAYLAHSQYGRNATEVTVNNNSKNMVYKTGYAGYTVKPELSSIERSVSDNTSTSGTFPYNNTYRGVLASTTGNIYGVYDLSGGVAEMCMGQSDSYSSLDKSGFSVMPDKKYYDYSQYPYTSAYRTIYR